MRKIFLILFCIIFLISIASSQETTWGTYKQTSCINLSITSDATSCLITSLKYPNSTNIITNVTMNNMNGEFSYLTCSTSQNGVYSAKGLCDTTPWENDFEITATGNDLTTADIIVHVLVFFISLLAFFGILFFAIMINGDYKRDSITGYIFALNNLKYLKYTLFGIDYGVLIFISYYSWIIAYSFLNMNFVSNIFQFLFYGLAILAFPLFILFVFILIANAIEDAKISDSLSRWLMMK